MGLLPDNYRFQVTAALVSLLEEAEPGTLLWRQVVAALAPPGGAGFVPLVSDEAKKHLAFRPSACSEALALVEAMERAPLREAAAALDRVIASREARDDYWPEGRLNAGIAYSLAGDTEMARRRLEEAAAVLEGRGIGREAAQMKA